MAIVQRDGAWVKNATPDQINAAYHAGELNDYLGMASSGTNLDGRPTQPRTDAEFAAVLGLTLAEFGQIESPESQAKIQAHVNAEFPIPAGR
jgi:hypothetical protein